MRRLILAAALALGAFLRADEPSLSPVDPLHPTAAWAPVIEALAHRHRIESRFVENRYHRVRRKPFTSPGVMRYDPQLGVSLARTTDAGEEVVLVKPDGLYRREAGRFEKIPYDVAATRAPRLLLAVVGFDPERVAQDFSVSGRIGAEGWHLELVPKSEEIRKVVSKLVVDGRDDRLSQITLHDCDFVRLEIFIHAVAFPSEFPAVARKDYFGQ